MNNYNNTVYLIFTSPLNVNRLIDHICKLLRVPTQSHEDISYSIRESVKHFGETIPRDLRMSDPLPGTTVTDQVNAYNQRFISYFINTPPITSKSRMLDPPGKQLIYAGSDVPFNVCPRPTEHTKIVHPQTVTNMLDTWRRAPANRPHALGDRDDDTDYTSRFESPLLDYTDSSQYGYDRHLDSFNTDFMEKLNNMRDPHERDIIGSGSSAIDESLANRRIFRSEEGVENGIPKRYTSVHQRHYDREIDGNLRQNIEYDCMLRKYDKSRILCKTERNRQLREQYAAEPPLRKKYDNRTNLYPVNLRIPG